MLVCFVVPSKRTRAIAAEIIEAAGAAADLFTDAGFERRIDEPADARDTLDFFLGEVLHETASATATQNAALANAVLLDEPATAADVVSATLAVGIGAEIAEPTTAVTTQDATVTSLPAFNQWNPADKSANVTLTGGLTVAPTTTTSCGVRGLYSATTGKLYFEVTWTNTPSGSSHTAGLQKGSTALNLMDTGGAVCRTDFGVIWINGGNTGISISSFSGFASGDVMCVAADLDNERIWFRRNGGQWNGSGTANPATNTGGLDISAVFAATPAFPEVSFISSTAVQAVANFGATAFAFTKPSGFTGWPAS